MNNLTGYEQGKVDICISLSNELEKKILDLHLEPVCVGFDEEKSKTDAEKELDKKIKMLHSIAENDYFELGEAYIEETDDVVPDPDCDE